MKTYFFLFFFALGSSLYCQNNVQYSVELKTGIVFFDLVKDPTDIIGVIEGWASQSGIEINAQRKIIEKLSASFEVGYSNFYYWNVVTWGVADFSKPSHYFNLNVGLNYKINKRLNLEINYCSYLLSEQYYDFEFQRRYFSTLDLTSYLRINNRLSIFMEAPLTIYPVGFQNNAGYFVSTGYIRPVTWVEIIGLSVGVKCDF